MPNSPTSSNGLALQATGENLNTWGVVLNQQTLQLIDSCIDGITTITLSTTSSITLTSTNYAANEARQHLLYLSGTQTLANTLIIPNVTKWYHVINRATSGGFGVTLGTSLGIKATVPASGYTLVYTNGTDTFALRTTDYAGQQIVGLADPTTASGAATRNYVLQRPLSDFQPPTSNVPFGGYRLTALGDPVSLSDAANMGWTLSSVSGSASSAASSAAAAASSAASAAQSAVSAGISAASALTSAASSLTYSLSAAISAASASGSAASALTSQVSAAISATSAGISAASALTSQVSAGISAASALTSAASSLAYSLSAAISATSASGSAASALTSQVSAGISATSAALSASAAASTLGGRGVWGGIATGTAAALVVTVSPALGSYTSGLAVEFVTLSANINSAVTLTVSGLSTTSLFDFQGNGLTANAAVSGGLYTAIYYTGGFRLAGGGGGIGLAQVQAAANSF